MLCSMHDSWASLNHNADINPGLITNLECDQTGAILFIVALDEGSFAQVRYGAVRTAYFV